jgi:hypothetical protein
VIADRRVGDERRSGGERRQEVVAVAENRRFGGVRRKTMRRQRRPDYVVPPVKRLPPVPWNGMVVVLESGEVIRDRRSDRDRREGQERRKVVKAVRENRRFGGVRRQGDRRQKTPHLVPSASKSREGT